MVKKLSIVLAFLILLQLSMSVYAEPQESFKDIQGHWAEDTINKFYEIGMVQGYPDGTFRPNNKITRVELITLINRFFGLKEKGTVNYLDVEDKKWYAVEAAKAKYYGLVEELTKLKRFL